MTQFHYFLLWMRFVHVSVLSIQFLKFEDFVHFRTQTIWLNWTKKKATKKQKTKKTTLRCKILFNSFRNSLCNNLKSSKVDDKEYSCQHWVSSSRKLWLSYFCTGHHNALVAETLVNGVFVRRQGWVLLLFPLLSKIWQMRELAW